LGSAKWIKHSAPYYTMAEALIESRTVFFRRYRGDQIQRHFLLNESRILSLLERHQAVVVSVNFMDPVTVAPTNEQRDAAFQEQTPHPEGSCPICQESLGSTDSVIRLRNCSHCFHRSCANTWYRMSVLCPCCRNDIRVLTES
jgi:hypothetical protein